MLPSSTTGLKEEVSKTSSKDIKCDVKKAYISHWLLQDLKSEFVCENINTWSPHYVDLTSPEVVKHFPVILIDGEKSPQLMEHFNSVATQFPVKSKHPETLKILENFINHALNRISNEEKVGCILTDAYRDINRSKKLRKSKIPVKTGKLDLKQI